MSLSLSLFCGLGRQRTGTPTPTLTLSSTSIDEDAASGTTVGTLSVTNGSGTYTFTETADPDAKFAVSGSNLNTAAALDYETATSHSVTVQASNGVDTPISRTFTISVNNVAETSGTLDPTITPPVLSLAVGATTYPPEFDATIDETVAVGDTLELEWSSDIRFGTTVGSAQNTIDSAEATANSASFTGLSSITSPSVYYYRARVIQADGDYSNWSDTIIHGEAVDETPATFTFTDVTNATTSTVYESNTVTLSGFNQPVTISVTGGEYAVDTGSGFGAYTSSAGTAYPSDQVKVRHTSSVSNSTATDTVLTVGGVSDTYTTTTEAGGVSLPTSGLLLRLDADDLSTLYQTVDGSTTQVSADADPVGYWGDKSGAGFHLAAPANDTTRPTYRANGGLPYIEFDGSNDILRRLSKLGIYDAAQASGVTIMVALRSATSSPSSNSCVVMEGNTGTTVQIYSALQAVGSGTTQANPFIRNDANSIFGLSGSPLISSAFDATDNVLTFTDNAGTVTGYDDAATTNPTRTYTPSGTLTIDTFALGAYRRFAAGNWWAGRVYAVAIWNRVLTSTERADALTYMASKQGRSL